MKADRQSMFGGQVLRTILFMGILLGIIYMYLKNTLKSTVAVVLLAAITFIDLWSVDKKYLNDDHFIPKDELQTESFTKNPVDEHILKDSDPHFRVFDVSRGMNDNRASYFHRSVLGYHAAKLRIYQDILEKYFMTSPNEQLLNALDVKYIINQNSQGQVDVVQNPGHFGAAWFVKAIKPVANDAEELLAIGHTNLKDTAVVQQSYMQGIGNIVADSSASITLKKYSNDEIEYTTSAVNAQFSVLSEVYYPAGWNAYIDGQKTEIVKTDYVLRGLKVPAGKHEVKLVFEPQSVKRGINISYLSSWLLIVVVLGGFFMEWQTNKNNKKAVD
ncbi:MAG TPA: YfhO family protein [Niabella sp.]|nr:YfhO family protein [Niabella sp.]